MIYICRIDMVINVDW